MVVPSSPRTLAALDLATPLDTPHTNASTSKSSFAGELAADPHAVARAAAMVPDRSTFTAQREAALIDTNALDQLPVDVRKRIGNIAVKATYRNAFNKENVGVISPFVMKAVIAPGPDYPPIDYYAPRSIDGKHLARAAGRGLPRAEHSLAPSDEMLVPVRLDAFGEPHRVKSLYDGEPHHSYTVRYNDAAENLATGKLGNLQEFAFDAEGFESDFRPRAAFLHSPQTRVVNDEMRVSHGEMRRAYGRPDVPAVEIRRASKTPESVLDEMMRSTAGSARTFEPGLGGINVSLTSRGYLEAVRANPNATSACQSIVTNLDGSRALAQDEALLACEGGGAVMRAGRRGNEATLTRYISPNSTTEFRIADLQKAFENPDTDYPHLERRSYE